MTTKFRARLWAAALLAIAGASANTGYSGASGTAVAASADAHITRASLRAVLPDASLRAQETFDRFLAGAMLGRKTSPDAAVRIRQVDTALWLFGVSATETGFTGHAAGASEAIAFTRADIVDWSYAPMGGRMHGNFAARAMMDVLPDHRAALIATTLSLDPMPKGW